jgi:hypothetical protein
MSGIFKEMSFLITKGGWSASKFRKSQIHKFVDINNVLDLRTFSKCGTLRICNFQTQFFLYWRICNMQT